MELVYHYTTLEALIGILRRDILLFRATNCLYQNDRNELKEGIDAINRFYGIQIQEASFRSYYITCFSKNNDSLPMWGMYAANGGGVALGLDINKICINYTGMVKCSYGKDDIDLRLGNVLNLNKNGKTFNLTESGFNQVNVSEEEKEHQKINLLIETCLSSKNKSYEYEGEFRCFVEDVDKKNEIHFKSRNGIIVPYIEVRIPKDALKQIIVGPTLNTDITKISILHFLSLLDYDARNIDIRSSCVPYRG